MDDLYKKIETLCKERNISITTMCRDAGVSRAPLSDLKMGRSKTLSSSTLSKIASYFGVSVDYLLGNVNEPYFYLDNQRIVDEINSLDEYEKKPSQEAGPENDYQERMLLLARKAVDIPKEQRDKIIKTFEDTIDLYLDAQGLKKKEDT